MRAAVGNCGLISGPAPRVFWERRRGANRGVGIGGGRVVALTDNTHLIALGAGSGQLVWDVAMTDWPASQYSASGAPLVVGKHVVTGVAGGEEGARGFVACYDLDDGRREWQFWTIPKPATDRCGITRLRRAPFEMGKRYFNGTGSAMAGGTRSVRALDIRSGNIVWDYPQVGTGRSASGTLSTQGGLIFFGEDSGVFSALDARTGRPLWHFSANTQFRASPMTYMVGGKQFVCIASAAGYLAFGLPDQD